MNDLSLTEMRVLSVAAVCGDVNRRTFNSACNIAEVHNSVREDALDSLRGDLLNEHTYRVSGEQYGTGFSGADMFSVIDPERGLVAFRGGKLVVDTHPLTGVLSDA